MLAKEKKVVETSSQSNKNILQNRLRLKINISFLTYLKTKKLKYLSSALKTKEYNYIFSFF